MVPTKLPRFSLLTAIRRTTLSVAVVGAAMGAIGVSGAGAQSTSALHQNVNVSWRKDNWRGNSRATFAIPGIGTGQVVCQPNTTWIQMTPGDPSAENTMWNVKFQTKNGSPQTAVKNVRVYRFSTPTSTVPHGTGLSGYEGFNQSTPIEAADSGSMVGLISKRAALNAPGGAGVPPTSFQLTWAWTGFGTSAARCAVHATFITQIAGRSRTVAKGQTVALKQALGPVSSFNLNWHGEADAPAVENTPPSLFVPRIGTLAATCQTGIDGASSLTLTPAPGAAPFASLVTYQGEGVDNSVQNDYYADPVTGVLGPIPLPVNGILVGTLRPAWYAPARQGAALIVSSLRKTNDPNPAENYCEISAQAVSAS